MTSHARWHLSRHTLPGELVVATGATSSQLQLPVLPGAANAFHFLSCSTFEHGVTSSCLRDEYRNGVYNDEQVLLRRTGLCASRLRTVTKRALLSMRSVHHLNVITLYGIYTLDDVTYLVTQSNIKGVLCDVLQNDKFNLDSTFKHSMSADLASGLAFLHKQDLVHGALTSRICLIDVRWTVKIADWPLSRLGKLQRDNRIASYDVNACKEDDVTQQSDRKLFWSAPEVIQAHRKEERITALQSADVYR